MRIALLSALLLTTTLSVAGCDMMRRDEQPKVGSLTQHLSMIDSDGRIYGSVELDPINGGKIFDADGRLIGRVVTPAPAAPPQYAPGVQ